MDPKVLQRVICRIKERVNLMKTRLVEVILLVADLFHI